MLFNYELSISFFCSVISAYICPVLVSLLVISTTLAITLVILHLNYVENAQRKMSKKDTILNHWGKHKPTQADLDKLYIGEPQGIEVKMK